MGHKNAKTCYYNRVQLVKRYQQGVRVQDLSEQYGISASRIYQFIRIAKSRGIEALRPRSSRPRRMPRETCYGTQQAVKALVLGGWRFQRISEVLGLPKSTLSVICRRMLGRHWKQKAPALRYEYDAPGGLLHLDIKRLSRFTQPGHRVTGRRGESSKGAGYEYAHVCIDDHSRFSYTEILPDQKGTTAAGFLRRALAYFASMQVHVQRVMTDNGPCYKSTAFKKRIQKSGLRHLFTRPYTPQTNGKAERFIKTLMNEWGYGKTYQNSQERNLRLPCYLNWYNWSREHGSLNGKPPASRIPFVNNVFGMYI